MSINHNKIKVVDLETSQPNKILITNENGALEFSDTKEILTNDLTSGGTSKALTAEMGKDLKTLLNTKENSENKSESILTDYLSNIKFPTVKSVYEWTKSIFKQKILTIKQSSGIAYTLQLSDFTNDSRLLFSNTNSTILTVPTNENAAIAIGSKIEYTQLGTGTVTVGGLGITFITNSSLAMAQGETRILTKIGLNEWTLEGNNKTGISPTVSNEFTEIQKFDKGVYLVDDEPTSALPKKLIVRSNPNNVVNTNPREFDFVASGRDNSPGWYGLFNLVHKNNTSEVLGAKFSLGINTAIPIATFYGKVNVIDDLTISGAFVSSYVRLTRASEFILDGGVYNAATYNIKTIITSPKRIAEYRILAAGGTGWHSMHRFIVKSNNDSTERSALEIESQDSGVCKITANGIFKMTQLDLTSLGSFANDTAASSGGVPIGYGYINSTTGALQRRLI